MGLPKPVVAGLVVRPARVESPLDMQGKPLIPMRTEQWSTCL
jgi:hypothetical protein